MAKLKHTYAHFKSIIGRRPVSAEVAQMLVAFHDIEQQWVALDAELMELNKEVEELKSSLAALRQSNPKSKLKQVDECLELLGNTIMTELPQQQ